MLCCYSDIKIATNHKNAENFKNIGHRYSVIFEKRLLESLIRENYYLSVLNSSIVSLTKTKYKINK